MKFLTRIFIALLAIFGVSALGYYAYILTSETLTFPFRGTDHQNGLFLEALISPPSLEIGETENPLLDTKALEKSLLIGGEKKETVSGEYAINVNGGYLNVMSSSITKGSKEIRISADIYNKEKTTKYRLPKDIVLTPSDIPSDLSVYEAGIPREQNYTVSVYGLGDYTSEDVRYYAHYDPTASCNVRDWGTNMAIYKYSYDKKPPSLVSGEATIEDQNALLASLPPKWIFKEIHPSTVLPLTKNGQIYTMTVHLPFDGSERRVCIIAGVHGRYRVVEDRSLEDFTLTGTTLDTLSPEYDMKSQVEFRFSQPIYTDSGALYSKEYIDHRSEAKIDFLKHLDISPSLPLTPADLILTPDRAIVTLPLKEGEKYTFSLRDISDIYGRKASITHEVIAKSSPFLSLKVAENRTIFKKGESIPVKLYSLHTPLSSYSLELCRVDLESYSQIERMLTMRELEKNSAVFDIMARTRKDPSLCKKKDLVIARDGYVSPFVAEDFAPSRTLENGLYVMTLANEKDMLDASRFFRPVIFSIIDTNITLKVDASGKIMVLATDIATGEPLPDQDVTVKRNVSRTYTENWDSTLGVSTRSYMPLATQAFAPGVALGRSGKDGFLEVKIDSLKDASGYDSTPYGLSFENWWEYEGRYDSFMVETRSPAHYGYVVSTWNDGITGYNFGIKDSDYSYASRSLYTAYFHTDRRLYLPGEKIYLHAIVRKNGKSLEIPKEGTFALVITDPTGREIRRTTVKPNEFGTISTEYDLPKDTSLGSYSVNIMSTSTTEYVENGWTNFQVEVFKNPTFTATVDLKSPDMDGDSLRNLRKSENTDPYSPWYSDVYTGNFTIEGIVKAKYYNGAEMKNMPFTYRVYRSEYYADDYWGDCFWGCYYEPPIEFFTEGTGAIQSDGYGIFRIPMSYSSFYSDYKYTVEITLKDPLSGETVTTPGSIVIKLPSEYKAFAPNNPLLFTPKKKILSTGETLVGEFAPTYGKWDKSLAGKYGYTITHRTYTETWVDDIRAGSTKVTTPVDTIVASGSIGEKDFSYRIPTASPGEYHFQVSPRTLGAEPPRESISESVFYIEGAMTSLSDGALRVIPERTIYKMGETAKVLIQVPFTGAHLLITKEKGGVLEREYVTLSGNTLTRNIPVDDSVAPNVYIGVVAFAPPGTKLSKTYAVGYGEIIVDIAGKKSLLTLSPNKTTYKNRENVDLDMTLSDTSGNPLQGEVAVMVVDESLIRLLGNIDLDIIPKFYQKFPFTVKTSLSLIGIERNRFLSRKGANGGSGDKGGGGLEIASRTLFKNTAYYNPSVRTDISGKAKMSFPLPDNITDYRIIAISNTRDSKFGVAEKTISVRKDYVLEAHLPMIVRPSDTFTLSTSTFNSTKRITPATLSLRIGTGADITTQEKSLSLDIESAKSTEMSITVPESWKGSVPYTLELRENGKVLDSITNTLTIAPLPILGKTTRSLILWTGSTLTIPLRALSSDTSPTLSTVDVSVAASYATQMQDAIRSLIQYPYGCIEQTISSTLPNAIALSLSENIGALIDRAQAEENTEKGVAKILRMQHYSGGWKYWETDTDANIAITPYVIRSLLAFRELGVTVPQATLDAGTSYIIANESTYANDPNAYAEATWTLASTKNEQAHEWWKRIDPNRLSSHGYLAYAYAAYDLGRLTPQIEKNLSEMMSKTSDSYMYWSYSADRALYIRFLFDTGNQTKALTLLDPLVRSIDLTSYYVSTQEKIQIFLALAKEASTTAKLTTPLSIAYRADKLISDLSLSSSKPFNRITTSREKSGNSITLKRDIAGTPLYVTTMTFDTPKDITKLPAYTTGGIDVTRSFEEIDESRGVDDRGEYRYHKEVTDGTFQKGKLYRATLTVNIPSRQNLSWTHLSVEDFLPGGWRPIRGIFQTESQLEKEGGDMWWWDYTEARDDRILATMSYGYGDKRIYTYYFRPESVGTYILPPATAYFMYQPELHSYTQYQKVSVKP